MTSHLLKTLREVLMDAVHVSFDFFKVLIPISIAMKILAELDWIRYLALPLEPVMQLTGLPADLGIAWATGIMVNFYSALIVFIGLLPGLPSLTTEQVTTLAVMMLIAHSIPAEGRIAAQCGVSFIGQAVIRLVVAVIGGVIVHTSCQAFGWLDTPARIVFTPSPDVNLLWWALGEVRNLVSIFCVIFFVMLLQRFLRYLKVADLIGRALWPSDVPVAFDAPEDRYTAMRRCGCMLAASGTATLETALADVPTVVSYRVAPFSALVGRLLIKVKWVSLTNLIMQKELFPELLQERATGEMMASQLAAWLDIPPQIEAVRAELAELRRRCGEPGSAARAAEKLLEALKES